MNNILENEKNIKYFLKLCVKQLTRFIKVYIIMLVKQKSEKQKN